VVEVDYGKVQAQLMRKLFHEMQKQYRVRAA